ncbi:MAG: hypothetical protein H8E30_08910, partial [Alphaproteobacteria bacterium]|nr:hypothetical protein [Alphaproteobacteria bacterium]
MAVIANITKQKLAAGELSLGMGVRLARGVEIAKVAKVCGYDWLFIDMEHSPLSLETVADITLAGLDAGCTPIVRASSHLHHHASRPLDAGAQGIVVPHVNTADEARRVVDQCLYPPIGHRSMAGGAAILEYDSLPTGDRPPARECSVLGGGWVATTAAADPAPHHTRPAGAAMAVPRFPQPCAPAADARP